MRGVCKHGNRQWRPNPSGGVWSWARKELSNQIKELSVFSTPKVDPVWRRCTFASSTSNLREMNRSWVHFFKPSKTQKKRFRFYPHLQAPPIKSQSDLLSRDLLPKLSSVVDFRCVEDVKLDCFDVRLKKEPAPTSPFSLSSLDPFNQQSLNRFP